MKSKIILFALILCCSTSCSLMDAELDSKPAPGKVDDDDYGGGGGRSSNSASIEVQMTDSERIEVYVSAMVGVVDISIVDSSATVVYNAVVDSADKNYISIDITNLDSGLYTIIYKSENGGLNKQSVFQKK